MDDDDDDDGDEFGTDNPIHIKGPADSKVNDTDFLVEPSQELTYDPTQSVSDDNSMTSEQELYRSAFVIIVNVCFCCEQNKNVYSNTDIVVELFALVAMTHHKLMTTAMMLQYVSQVTTPKTQKMISMKMLDPNV